MTYDKNDPFALAGSIIGKNHFIGREIQLEELEGRVIRPEDQRGSRAIVGLPQIGKSCLVNVAFIERKAELYERKLVPITMNIREYRGREPEVFFRDLVFFCNDTLDELNLSTPSIRTAARRLPKKELTQISDFSRINRFFERVYQSGIRTIFILDHFDEADFLFKNETALQRFRDLTNPEHQVTWVVLVRRPLLDIEMKHIQDLDVKNQQILSDGLFMPCKLAMLEQEDVETYFRLLINAGIALTKQQKEAIHLYCGRHPYLLSLIGSQLAQRRNNHLKEADVERAFQEVETHFFKSYEKIIELLQEDSLFQSLLELLFGPVYNLEQRDIDTLRAYGLICLNPRWSHEQSEIQTRYFAFSQHFQTYLQEKLSSTKLSSPIEQAEQSLYKIMVTILNKPENNHISYVLPECVSFEHLFPFIFGEWTLFQPYFYKTAYKDKQEWHAISKILIKMRGPLIQEKIDLAMKASYRDTQMYCEEIIKLLNMLTEPEMVKSSQDLAYRSNMLLPGDVLWDRYKICEELVTTGHSQVAKTWDKELERFLAIKLLYSRQSLDMRTLECLQERLKREARILTKIDHKNIGPIYDIRQHPPATIMKWVEGESFNIFWKKKEYVAATELIQQGLLLAEALEHIHSRDIIHRDVKPKNIIVREDGEPILIDFDIARTSIESTLLPLYDETNNPPFLGSPEYSSPEQFTDPYHVRSSADIFSLGVVLYEVLAGERPYASNRITLQSYSSDPPVRGTIPDAFYQVLILMLHPLPERRPTARQLVDDFKQCLL